MATILQSSLLTDFLYPFMLIFFISFALLEKVKIFGSDKKQLNALVAMVIGLIFVGAVFPKLVVQNMILFLTVGLVIIFVGLMLWGFVAGKVEPGEKTLKFFSTLLGASLIASVLWATGSGSGAIEFVKSILAFLFDSSSSSAFWTNFVFVVLVVLSVVAVMKVKSK